MHGPMGYGGPHGGPGFGPHGFGGPGYGPHGGPGFGGPGYGPHGYGPHGPHNDIICCNIYWDCL